MKVGIIGAGRWGRNLVRTLNDMDALGAVVEIDPVLRRELESAYPTIPIHSDYRAVLDSNLAALVVATPAVTHYSLCREILLAGKHVFVEKPMTLKADEAVELANLARQRELVLMVGHLLLYQPAVRFIREYLQGGRLGAVRSIHQVRLNLGRARSVENVLWSLGVHDVAVALHLVGEAPDRVRVVGQRVIQGHIEDDVYLHLDFPSGVQAHLHTSWLWPEKRRRMVVVGDDGMLVYDESDQTVVLHRKGITPTLENRDNGQELLFRGHGEPLRLELEHFLLCVSRREQPLSSGESAVPVIRVLEEASKQLARQWASTSCMSRPM